MAESEARTDSLDENTVSTGKNTTGESKPKTMS